MQRAPRITITIKVSHMAFDVWRVLCTGHRCETWVSVMSNPAARSHSFWTLWDFSHLILSQILDFFPSCSLAHLPQWLSLHSLEQKLSQAWWHINITQDWGQGGRVRSSKASLDYLSSCLKPTNIITKHKSQTGLHLWTVWLLFVDAVLGVQCMLSSGHHPGPLYLKLSPHLSLIWRLTQSQCIQSFWYFLIISLLVKLDHGIALATFSSRDLNYVAHSWMPFGSL